MRLKSLSNRTEGEVEESHGDDNGDYDREDDADDGGGGDDGGDDLAETRVPAQKGELEESQE